ncbi:MAG: siderophore-interacting protein [Parvibaculum sp.]|nr:siderophore-interacting protein [Parvibaculum sp.]
MLKKPGIVEASLLKWLTRPAHVSDVREINARFRIFELEGESLRDAAWMPGQKAQMQLGGFVSRTYTPMGWDNAKGTTRFLAYLHGDAPASRWAAALKPGDLCLMFGPHRSLDVGEAGRPLILFGDETSFGLAASMAATKRGAAGCSFLFEVTSEEESRQALDALGIAATLVERRAGDTHLDALAASLERMIETDASTHFALTGKAPSIQRLSRGLKQRGITSAQIKAKAYWAPGKTGLD